MADIKSLIWGSRPDIEEITVDTYVSRINSLKLSMVNFEDFDNNINIIKKRFVSQKTIKSCITAIVVYLKATHADEELLQKYSKELLKVGTSITEQDQKNEKTLKDTLVTRNEIEKIIENLKNKLDSEKLIKDNHVYFDLYQQYLVINLYFLILPLRNDYVNLEVYQDSLPFFIDNKKNYIILNKKKLILNRYKTSKIYGKGNTLDLPQKLVDIISKWFEIRSIIYPDLSDQKILLLNKKLIPMSQVNLTQYLNKIFNKNVSSTMLRKSYISEKYPVTHTTSEMVEDARKMMHSVSLQQSTYRKK